MANGKASKAATERPEAGQPEEGQPDSAQPETEAGARPDVADDDPPAADQVLDDAVQSDVIAQLESQVAEYRDRMLRAMAELENLRRRAERDRKEAEAYGGTRLARDLLAVYDNLERALAHADDAAREHAGGVIEGVELTRRELLSAFAKHKIEKFTPEKGEKFDPHREQAMYEAPVPGAQPGTVIEVIQPGFTIADRLLRPALVGVAKAAPEETGKPETPAESD